MTVNLSVIDFITPKERFIMIKKAREQEKAILLREQGWLISAIAKELSVSKSSVSIWVREVIPNENILKAQALARKSNRQKAVEATIKKSVEIRNKYKEEAKDIYYSLYNDIEFCIGIVLYAAEGAKSEDSLDFCNCDSRMIRLMLQFFRSIGIPDYKILVKAWLHPNKNIEVAKQYWQKQTGFSNIVVYQFKEGRSKGIRKNTNDYGVGHLIVHSVEYAVKMRTWIDLFLDNNS